MSFADPHAMHPVRLPSGESHQGTVFLKPALDHPRIEAGDYSYMSSHDLLADPAQIAARLAPYLYEWSPEKLVIGKFCQIAHGVRFVTSSANHRHDGLSSFPFAIFDDGPMDGRASMPGAGRDTIVGHDVWFGTDAMILPGARIGDGAIIGAGAVVGGEVAPYTVVAGNPARARRARLSKADAKRMQDIAWWDWPIALIAGHEALICGTDLDALEQIAKQGA